MAPARAAGQGPAAGGAAALKPAKPVGEQQGLQTAAAEEEASADRAPRPVDSTAAPLADEALRARQELVVFRREKDGGPPRGGLLRRWDQGPHCFGPRSARAGSFRIPFS